MAVKTRGRDTRTRAREPRRQRKPREYRRAAWLRDRRNTITVIAAVVAVILYSVLVPIQVSGYGSPVLVTMLLAAAAVGAPLVSARHPGVSMLLFTASALLLPLTVPRVDAIAAPWPWSVPMLLAFAAAVAALTLQHGWRQGLFQLILGSAAGLTAAIMLPVFPSANSLIVTTSVVGGIYLVAVLVAGRLRLGDELTRERAHTAQEQARRMLVEERTRIARELHDVIAHSMSVIQVQASTARYRLPALADDAAAEFDSIAATARGSLLEMRRMLGVLRTEDHAAELTPQQGIADLPALVDSMRRAGADVELSLDLGDTTVEASPAVQIAVFRIAQEGLSNAVRHAPGATVRMDVRADAGEIRILIRNDAFAEPPASQGPGYGLRGMRERAELLGGRLTAGPDDGGWTVDAVLPLVPAEAGAPGIRPEKERP